MKTKASAQRTILHFDLDSFFVSVERLKKPELMGKPLIIGGTSDRGVVACCSYEARKFGIHAAMPTRQARQLCPEALFISGDMELYSHYSGLVTEILDEQAPLLEKASVDEFYIDATGLDKFFGCYKWATELRQRIMRETGLPISLGMGTNKMIAKVATGEAKPNGQLEVPAGTEQAFLDPLPIEKLPMVGHKTQQLLANMGIRKVGVLRQMPVQMLENLFGKNGAELWRRAHGWDDSLLTPYHDPKSISTEDTLSRDTMNLKDLKTRLAGMTEKVAYRLRNEKKLSGCLTVKLRYSDFTTVSKQVHLSYTAADETLIAKALELFDKLYERGKLIRLVGVRVSQLVEATHQLDLFTNVQKQVQLHQAMDKMRQRYGTQAVVRAIGFNQEESGSTRAAS